MKLVSWFSIRGAIPFTALSVGSHNRGARWRQGSIKRQLELQP